LPTGTRTLVLEMHRLVLMDTSGLDALLQLRRLLARQGVRLMLCELNEQPLSLIQRAGADAILGDNNMTGSLNEALARTAAPRTAG
jgi:SulP family sulfate permease